MDVSPAATAACVVRHRKDYEEIQRLKMQRIVSTISQGPAKLGPDKLEVRAFLLPNRRRLVTGTLLPIPQS